MWSGVVPSMTHYDFSTKVELVIKHKNMVTLKEMNIFGMDLC